MRLPVLAVIAAALVLALALGLAALAAVLVLPLVLAFALATLLKCNESLFAIGTGSAPLSWRSCFFARYKTAAWHTAS